jgi:hypothetical protein
VISRKVAPFGSGYIAKRKRLKKEGAENVEDAEQGRRKVNADPSPPCPGDRVSRRGRRVRASLGESSGAPPLVLAACSQLTLIRWFGKTHFPINKWLVRAKIRQRRCPDTG